MLKNARGGVEAFRFINVLKVSPDAGTRDWRIFEFDGKYRLRSITTAESGTYTPAGGWTLHNVVETRLPQLATGSTAQTAAGTEVIPTDTRAWRSELRPDIFGVLMVQPERMAGWDLAHYIQHLAENRQQTEVYEIAFWSKLFYPWAVLVMMALALPFAYLHVRAGGMSLKIFTGVMIGVGRDHRFRRSCRSRREENRKRSLRVDVVREATCPWREQVEVIDATYAERYMPVMNRHGGASPGLCRSVHEQQGRSNDGELGRRFHSAGSDCQRSAQKRKQRDLLCRRE